MDYPIAQTNLQLYRQMIDQGFGEDSLLLANRAYLLAAGLSGGLLRGSGKPFVCHLVGTASALVECRMGPSCIAAALLHAAYQDRVPFPVAKGLEDRRDHLRRHFGEEVENLVHSYHRFEAVALEALEDDRLRACREVVAMRLADEIDDLVDDGLCLHGQPGDDASVEGGADSRRERTARRAPEYLRISQVIGTPSLGRHFARWQARLGRESWPGRLRTGAYGSFRPDVDGP